MFRRSTARMCIGFQNQDEFVSEDLLHMHFHSTTSICDNFTKFFGLSTAEMMEPTSRKLATPEV